MSSAGQDFYPQIQQLIAGYGSLLQDIHSSREMHEGRIKVSATTTSNHLITQMIARFLKTTTDITVELKIDNRENLVKQLQDFEPDLVLMGETPPKLDLISEQLIPNPLVMVAHPEHPLANKKNISLTEAAKEDFVVREPGSGTRESIATFFENRDVKFTSSLELGSNEAIKHAVAAGLGVGIVSMHSILLELQSKNLVILDVKDFPINRYWHIVQRKGKHLHPAAQGFQRFIMKEAEAYLESYEPFITWDK